MQETKVVIDYYSILQRIKALLDIYIELVSRIIKITIVL